MKFFKKKSKIKVPKKPSIEAINEAKKFPNGYVYAVDASFENEADVPPQAIQGAWKVNDKGQIIGNFIPNPNYVDLNSL